MSCAEFRRGFQASSRDAEVLEHIRSCDACLDYAAHVDPDIMFAALGGDLTPPGGVDAFVSGVMSQVRLRSAEEKMAPRRSRSFVRLAAAAAMAAAIVGTSVFYERSSPVPSPVPVVRATQTKNVVMAGETKPPVEAYDSAGATIVELPADNSDTQVVMIFDENLPADL